MNVAFKALLVLSDVSTVKNCV